MPPRKILFCTDFSENSLPALELALDYAESFAAQLLIVHAIDTPDLTLIGEWPGELAAFMKSLRERADDQLDNLARKCRQRVNDVQAFCLEGFAPKEIVALAAKEAVDLIVLGTHGRTGVKHLVMGSVARNVLSKAHRPVLIVEAPKDKGETTDSLYEPQIP